MLSSGVKRLDDLMGGGVEEGRVVLVETIAGVGDILALNFVAEALKRGKRTFLILGRKRVEDVREFLEKRGAGTSKLTIVTTSEKSDRRLNLDELFMISHTVKELAKSNEFCGIDILLPLLILHDPRKVYSLFSEVVGILRESNVTAVITIDKRFVDERTLAMFEELADIVIEVEEVVDGLRVRRGIRIKKNALSPPTNFYTLEIRETNFEIGDEVV